MNHRYSAKDMSMPVPFDLAVSRQVPLATLWHADHGGPPTPFQKRIGLLELASLIAGAPRIPSADTTILAVAAGSRRGLSIRIRSVVVFQAKDGDARAFAYVEHAILDRRFERMQGAIHVVTCELLPERLSFVDCAPRASLPRGRVTRVV